MFNINGKSYEISEITKDYLHDLNVDLLAIPEQRIDELRAMIENGTPSREELIDFIKDPMIETMTAGKKQVIKSIGHVRRKAIRGL